MIGLKSIVVLCLELERAAKWAEEHYKDTDKTYLVTLNLKSERFTYCTKIIYQAYKYGVSKIQLTNMAYSSFLHTRL